MRPSFLKFFRKFFLETHSPLPLERGGFPLIAGRRGVALFLFGLFLFLARNTSAQSINIQNPFLDSPTHLFTAKLTYKDQTFNGYLGVKYADANNFRVSFNTAMGSTLIDLEWKDGEFTKHYLPEQLDRGIVINKLQDDFEMMFLHILAEGKWKNDTTLKVGCHKHRFILSEQNLPLAIEDHNWLGFLKRTLTFDYTPTEAIGTVSLKHHSFALQLQLTSIE